MLCCLRHVAPQVRSPWPTCPGGMNKHDRVPLSSHSGDPPVCEPRRQDTGSLPNQRTIHISNALTLNEPTRGAGGHFSYIFYCLRKLKLELFCNELSHLHLPINSLNCWLMRDLIQYSKWLKFLNCIIVCSTAIHQRPEVQCSKVVIPTRNEHKALKL